MTLELRVQQGTLPPFVRWRGSRKTSDSKLWLLHASACTGTHTNTHLYIHTPIYLHIYTFTHSHTNTYTRLHTHTFTHTYTYRLMHTHIYILVHTHTLLYIDTFTHSHTHTHTEMQNKKILQENIFNNSKTNQPLKLLIYMSDFNPWFSETAQSVGTVFIAIIA